MGHTVTVCAPAGWIEQAIGEAHFYALPETGPRRKNLAELIEKINPDILHVHGVRALSWSAFLPIRRKNVYTEHLWTNDFKLPSPLRTSIQRQMVRMLARGFGEVVSVSQATSAFFARAGIRSTVISGAILPIVKAAPHPESRNTLVIGTLGTLTPVKGVDILIQVVNTTPSLRLVVGGDGPSKPVLTSAAGPTVSFVGAVTDPATFYGDVQAYAQLSRSESFGLTVLEAMSAGLPVVVSDRGGLPELVTDGVEGFVVPLDRPDIIRERLISLQDTALRARMGEAATKRATYFSPHRMTEAYDALYRRMIHA
jgi:glycosyltransferase involved in cell wall biosynthesis